MKQLAHVCIATTDLEKTRVFYVEGLGCREHFRFLREGEVVGYYLEIGGGTYLEVFEREEVPDGKSPLQHFCIEVEELEGQRELMLTSGVEVTEPKLGKDGSWQAWLTDPNGVRIELHQYTERSSQRTREDCVLGSVEK